MQLLLKKKVPAVCNPLKLFMNFSQNVFKTNPFHLLLLPVYFIFHMYFEYAGLLKPGEIFSGFLKILAAILTLFFLFRIYFKNISKAAVIVTIIGSLYLFFGNIKNTFSQIPLLNFFGHYKTIIPLSIIFLVILFIRVVRSKQLIYTTLFLNVLFSIYLGIDLLNFLSPQIKQAGITDSNIIKSSLDSLNEKLPNIYYLLLDCYPSTGYQQEMLDINKNTLDSFLTNNNFYIVNNSKSNYSHTAFSMASTFGMNYLTGIDTSLTMNPVLYNRSMEIVNNAVIFKILKQKNYNFYNLSIFNILNLPAYNKELFLSVSTQQIIFYNTFWNCIRRDLFWQLFPGYINKNKMDRIENMKKFFEPQRQYNIKLLDTLSKFALSSKKINPWFLYAHLKMPHFPYFYDSSGNAYPEKEIYTDSLINDRKKFKGYISYTNDKAKKLINELLNNNNKRDIIIIQSDHCIADMDWSRKKDAFRNYTAYYFPDKDYSLLNDSMSNVNTFRVICNKYFGQKMELLPYKSYYIR